MHELRTHLVTRFDLKGMKLEMGIELGPFDCMFKEKIMSNYYNI